MWNVQNWPEAPSVWYGTSRLTAKACPIFSGQWGEDPHRACKPQLVGRFLLTTDRAHIGRWGLSLQAIFTCPLHYSPLSCNKDVFFLDKPQRNHSLWLLRLSFLGQRGRQRADCQYLGGTGQEDGRCCPPAGGDHTPAFPDS